MSMPVYNWMIVYDDGTTETVEAEDVAGAVYGAENLYDKNVRAVIRTEYA